MLLETLDKADFPAVFKDFEIPNPLIFRASGAHVVQLVRSRKPVHPFFQAGIARNGYELAAQYANRTGPRR